MCAGTEVTQVLSSSHTGSGRWEAELDGDADMSECLETPAAAAKGGHLRQQFSSEMTKKFEVRARTSVGLVTVACEYTHTRASIWIVHHVAVRTRPKSPVWLTKPHLVSLFGFSSTIASRWLSISHDVLTHPQGRYKMVEVYNKQSLKTVQQHVSTLSAELAKCRSVAFLPRCRQILSAPEMELVEQTQLKASCCSENSAVVFVRGDTGSIHKPPFSLAANVLWKYRFCSPDW